MMANPVAPGPIIPAGAGSLLTHHHQNATQHHQNPTPQNHPMPPAMSKRKARKDFLAAANENLSLEDAAKQVTHYQPSKTPVSVLQEILSRKGITPNYELVQIEGAIHEPIFRYSVFMDNTFFAAGTGRSKKEAKHAAAKNLLDLLAGKQNVEQANSTTVSTTSEGSAQSVVSPHDDKVMGNPIGWLQEMCMSRRWPPPLYSMENEDGLPHDRVFTIACKVLKYQEIGTGKSKKLAKRVAAHKMWQTLQDVPHETNNAPNADEDDESAYQIPNLQRRYSGLKDSKISTLSANNSQTLKVAQFHKYLKQASGPKISELQQTKIKDCPAFQPVLFLHEIAQEQKFEVTYVDIEEKSVSGKFQCLVQLSTLPVAVSFGSGTSLKAAQSDAARNALEYLKIMTRK